MDGATKAKPKTRKPRSLPPPGEAFGANKDASRKKAKAKPATKKPAAPKKTPAKPKAAAKKSNDGGQVDAGNGISKPAPVKRGRPAKDAKPKPISIYRAVLSESNSIDIFSGATKKKEKEPGSLLMRRTAAAQRARDDMDKPNIVRKPGTKQQSTNVAKKESGSEKVFRVMDLPQELRAMVWHHAVFNPRAFVWPEKYTGHEQPDLAMTCRLVRAEVLPIFYAENIFAINLSPQNEPSYQKRDEAAKGKKNVVLHGGIPVIAEWAKALEAAQKKPGWFSMVRKWAFSYSPRALRDPVTNRLVLAEYEKGFVVTVNFSKRQQDGLFWDASIEIHRFALCVLPSYEEYGTCKVKTVPAWLNDPVIAITEAAKGGSISEKMITGLAKEITRKAIQLERLRCEPVLQRAEPYCDR
jgi:hypothetical protein